MFIQKDYRKLFYMKLREEIVLILVVKTAGHGGRLLFDASIFVRRGSYF